MDYKRAETLLSADLDRLTSRAADPVALLDALGIKVGRELDAIEAHLAETRAKVDLLPARLRDERALVAKIDVVLVKLEGGGRADLLAAATARKAKYQKNIEALEAESAALDAELARAEALREGLAARRDELAASQAELSLAAPAPAEPTAEPAPAATEPAPAEPTAEPAATEPAPADDLDAEFAALLAGMGEELDLDEPAATDEDDEDPLAGLPSLVEVGDDELPEGADPDSDEPIDFSSLDDLPVAKAAAAAGGSSEAPAPAKAGAKPPAKAGAKPPAKAEASGGSKKARWFIIGGVIIAAGGTVAALFALGVL